MLLLDSAFDFGMAAHTKVIIGTPHRDGLFSPAVFKSRGKFCSQSVNFLENTVGVVLLLTHDLLMKEVLVLELAF